MVCFPAAVSGRDPDRPIARRERHEGLLEQPIWLTLIRVLPVAGLLMAVNGFVRSGLRTPQPGESAFQGYTGTWGVVILLALGLLLYGCISLLVPPRPPMWISSVIVIGAGIVLADRVDSFKAHLASSGQPSRLVTPTTFGGTMELVPRGASIALVTGSVCLAASLGYGMLRVARKRRQRRRALLLTRQTPAPLGPPK